MGDVAGRDSGLGRTRLVLIALVAVVGVLASLFAWREESQDADAREATLAEQVGGAAMSTATNAVAGLSGAPALVRRDGSVETEAFEAFQRDVSSGSSLQAIAYVPVIRGDERAAFESRIGKGILDLGDGGFAAAGRRDVYWPVQTVSPVDPLTRALIGLDVAHEPITADVARSVVDSGATAITESISFQPIGSLFFILKALYRPGADLSDAAARREAHVGFVASVYLGSALRQGVEADLADDDETRYEIRDGSVVLARSAPAPEGGVSRTIEVGGRTWTVLVEDARAVTHPLTLLIVAITLFVVVALGYLALRSLRFERDTARNATLLGRTADLAQQLSGAATVDDVAVVIGDVVPAIFGARAASLGLVDRDRGIITVLDGPDVDPQLTEPRRNQDLDLAGPLTDAVRSGDIRMSNHNEHSDWRSYVAGSGARVDVAETAHSCAGLPLDDSDGTVIAAVAILWARRHRFDEVTVAAMRTVTELCEQTLQRAELTDHVARRAARLASLAEGLAGAGSVAEATSVITSRGRRAVGAVASSIGIADRGAGVLRIHHGDTVPESMSRRYTSPPLDAPLAFTEAARTGEAVLVPDYRSYLQRYPDTDPSNSEIGEGARAVLPLRDSDETIGAIAFSWATDRAFDDALVSTLWTIAEMAAQTLQRARLSEEQQADARHSRDLAVLAQGLASRAHTEDVTGFLASSVITPLDAAHAVVGLIGDGVLHRHFSTDLDVADEHRALLDSTPLSTSTPLTDAARTGEDVLLGDVDALGATHPELVPVWDAVGFAATANLPLRDRTGEVIGALGIAWSHPVTFDKELRDRLTTIRGIAAQTLERAQLADELRDTADRNEALADFAQHVARVRTVDELCRAVAERGALPAEAAIANLSLLDEAAHALRVHPNGDYDPEMRERFATIPIGADVPVAEALRSQTPVLLSSPEEIAERYPAEVVDWARRSGIVASVHLPLVAPGGTRLGTVTFGWRSPRQFDAALPATLRTISELLTQTIERTRLGESEHRLVASLQHRVVTPLPPTKDLSIAQRYRPAARHVGMGGDWYDGLVLDENRYALVVGDVAGHGITAVADMIQLRATIEALVRADVQPDGVLAEASGLLESSDVGVTASACIFVVDTAAGTVSYAVAGHPPPILRRGDGQVTLLEDGRQPLLGIPVRRGELATVPFPPDAVLVAYTDGLIERREEVIDESIERLRRTVAGSSLDGVEAFADALIAGCLDDRDPEDDVALVVVHHRVATG